MSDSTLDLREQIARIDRMILETQKFVAEHDKLAAEARKLDRDRMIAPWQVTILTVGSIAGLLAAIISVVTVLKSAGVI